MNCDDYSEAHRRGASRASIGAFDEDGDTETPDDGAAGAVQVSAQGAAGERVDRFLAARLAGTSAAASRSRIQRWIALGAVQCADRPVTASTRLAGFETFVVTPLPEAADTAFAPDPVALNIVHRSDDLLVIDKPAGLVVHPAAGNWRNTLLNGLLFLDPSFARLPRAGIVHRLDKDTSGLMVVAASERAMVELAAQVAARSMSRRYLAIVHGSAPELGCVDAAIGRDPSMRLRMAVLGTAHAKPARTHFRRLSVLGDARPTMSLLECRLETGRTHQIRVHLSSIGHPIVGDALYGGTRAAISRQALHAWRLGLVDPGNQRAVRWTSVPPPDMLALAQSGGLNLSEVCDRLDREISAAR